MQEKDKKAVCDGRRGSLDNPGSTLWYKTSCVTTRFLKEAPGTSLFHDT